jgi:hypothetical protein
VGLNLTSNLSLTSRFTHVKCYTKKGHMSGSKVMSLTSKAPRHEHSTRCVQCSSSTSLKNVLLLGPPHLHDHSLNPSIIKSSKSLHASNPSVPMPSRAQHPSIECQHSSSKARCPLSKQLNSMWPYEEVTKLSKGLQCSKE